MSVPVKQWASTRIARTAPCSSNVSELPATSSPVLILSSTTSATVSAIFLELLFAGTIVRSFARLACSQMSLRSIAENSLETYYFGRECMPFTQSLKRTLLPKLFCVRTGNDSCSGCVCVCVCVRACVRACVRVCFYVCVYVCPCLCVCMCVSVPVYNHVCLRLSVCPSVCLCLSACLSVCLWRMELGE